MKKALWWPGAFSNPPKDFDSSLLMQMICFPKLSPLKIKNISSTAPSRLSGPRRSSRAILCNYATSRKGCRRHEACRPNRQSSNRRASGLGDLFFPSPSAERTLHARRVEFQLVLFLLDFIDKYYPLIMETATREMVDPTFLKKGLQFMMSFMKFYHNREQDPSYEYEKDTSFFRIARWAENEHPMLAQWIDDVTDKIFKHTFGQSALNISNAKSSTFGWDTRGRIFARITRNFPKLPTLKSL
ncbi:hypothetical protein KEM48_014304 [Puccinia striiformis f. sp. tritici PST-130]|nr:hypothetical protein KEM48_014304 [Puccinia striiformis f. sp. tritici PST-130]